jgi:plastocyanin
MTQKGRRLLVIAALLVALVAAACSETQANKVTIRDLRFNPKVLDVAKGATVTWTNEDQTAHTITSDSFDSTSAPAAQKFTSKALNPGDSFTPTFDAVGTYRYHCTIHPYLKGTIVVR